MNSANEPDAVQPISNSVLSIHAGPLKCSAAIGVMRPMNVKMIIVGLRPMRSEMNGTMKPQMIVANPIGATTWPASTSDMPLMSLKNNGRKMMPTRYQETMKIEMPEHTRMLRCLSISKMPAFATLDFAACATGVGSLTKSQISTAQISP